MPQTHQTHMTIYKKLWEPIKPTAILVFPDGTAIYGEGAGAEGVVVGELCFNTAMSGYQEILTDPSYNRQIVTFTFPHIGNVGCNLEDTETLSEHSRLGASGAIFKAPITNPANYRATQNFDEWLKNENIVAISNVDTRALTHYIRNVGAKNIVIAHNKTGEFDLAFLTRKAQTCPSLVGQDLAKGVSNQQIASWQECNWSWPNGYSNKDAEDYHIVVVDYGVKRNILRSLKSLGANITIVPSNTTADKILQLKPDGVVLSNGPGDPAATAIYAKTMILALLEANIPLFGICLGHQLLALTLGAKTIHMLQGHRGANHPVKDINTGKVEIVSMNHGFTVESSSLPTQLVETHISLFDGSNCGLRLVGRPAFSVQYHPESSPGPQDSYYLFKQFREMMDAYKSQK